MDTFGEWLRQQRVHLRLTHQELADRVGCSVVTIRKIEYGERRPSRQIAELIASSLNISPEEHSTFIRVARGELSVNRLSPFSNPVTASKTHPINLPVLPTPLIGRQPEVEDLSHLLRDPECRLLTLVGPGGIGKTRLAIETAAHMQNDFNDGVYFVPFAPVNSTRFIVPLIANAIGFVFESSNRDDPKTQLFSFLREKQVLLLADNLEQLLTEPGIEVLAELLENALQIKLMVTSRESLGFHEEWVYEVYGLPVPENISAEENGQNTSVELFLQRARRAYFGFNARPQDYPAILHVCQLVEGNPLGIELAASWVRTLSCDEIEQEIKREMDFLRVSARDTPARHRSMRAVFDHSWKLLTEEEKGVLLRLSAFKGGFQREAAEQVAGATLSVLSTLMTKSLIRRSGAGRYDLHVLIRQFAAEHLATSPEVQNATQACHGRYFLEYLSQTDGRLRSSTQREALIELTTEIDNLRSAWDWAVVHGEFALIEQTLRAWFMLYDTRCWFQEGLETIDRAMHALEVAHGPSPSDRTVQVALGHLLSTRAWLAFRLDNYEHAKWLLERSIDILRPLNKPHVLVEAITYFGLILEVIGNYARAEELYSEGLEIATAIGDRWFAAVCLSSFNGLVVVAHRTAMPENAHERSRSAVADWRLIGDPRGTAFGLRIFSQSAFALGRYDEARLALEESAALNNSINFRWGVGSAYRGLAFIAQAQGKHQQAVDMFRKSLDTFTELGGSWWGATVLAEMSRSLLALENDVEAERVLRESLRIANKIHGTPIALQALVEFASLQAKQGNIERAHEILLIVLNHLATLPETKNRAGNLLIEFEAQLTSQQIEVALTRIKTKAFEDVVDEVLKHA